MQRGMATRLRADGIGAARIVGPGLERIVGALAKGVADRVDRRHVKHVESHRTQRRQPGDHIIEGAVDARLRRL